MKLTIIKPVVSEKALAGVESNRTYSFMVPTRLNKIEIAQAVTQQFNVKVLGVNITNLKGKPKSAIVKRGRLQLKGSRNDAKKAYVQLAEGEVIKLFEEPKNTKATKTATKRDKKVKSNG